MKDKKLRWGFLSTAQIARKNWNALRNSGNSTLVAVASRDLERSQSFIAECQSAAPMSYLPEALGSYEELLASPAIDAVYLPLPTGIRKEWVLRAAAAGKHILCEKPCATSVADLIEMLEACRRARVQFMDGVMFMHSRRLERMRWVFDDGDSVGKIKRITSVFSFHAEDEFFRTNIRASSLLEPYGCLGDLGWYCIRLALWAMKEKLPQRVSGRILRELTSSNGARAIPTEFSGELFFDHDVSTAFYCSFLTHDEQAATISGEKGYLQISDFVVPFLGSEISFGVTNAEFKVIGCDFNMDARQRRFTIPEYSNSHPTAQETNMFRNFADQVLSGGLNETWPVLALNTQKVMNACYESALAEGRSIDPSP